MASRKRPVAMEKLPDDILFDNICIRLPAKLVAQMRCVSKPWNAYLCQPSFIKSHRDRFFRNNDETLMIIGHGFPFDGDKPYTTHNSQSPYDEVTHLIKLPANMPNSENICYNAVVGSINGLVCFASYESDACEAVVYIWNPSLSALLTLPPHMFGFDPKTDDYKVVKLSFHTDYPSNPLGWPPVIYNMQEVEVYSMKKGCWDIITPRFPSHIAEIYDGNEVCVDGHDGHIHWLCAINQEKTQQTIVTFDVGLETFGEISLPHPIQDGNASRTFVLGKMAGKLCVMSYVDDEYEVWVMGEYGVAESWAKQNIFSHFSGKIDPFGFTLNSEFLFGIGHRLALYDPNGAKNPPSKALVVAASLHCDSKKEATYSWKTMDQKVLQ
ncbi:F-box domain-containing protein [Artemisia annua]|uniref:F-box domain-containing protein n=1 Tax=Artemisia annua TaxID=35608 RepID=A0A2U1LNH2_ARTAN|nr:F-box domain-containing protein [Artemisia annua]